MPFDDIYRKWEQEIQGNSSAAKKSLEKWLRENPVKDKDHLCEQEERAGAGSNWTSLKHLAPQRSLDLHGYTAEEGIKKLRLFILACRKEGLRKVLIIHGKGHNSPGQPVLGRTVRQFLERSPHAGRFEKAPRTKGGSGATVVFLRRSL